MRKQRYLYLLVFTVGFLITATELLATPLLAPAFGTSLVVWTVVIGIFIGSLAIGYIRGGKLSDAYPDTLRPLLLRVGIAGMLVALTPFISAVILPRSALLNVLNGSLTVYQLFGALLAMLGIFVIPTVLMSMTSPFVIGYLQREASSTKQAGRIAGRIFSLSTTGSLLGVFLGPLVALPLIGTRATFVVGGLFLVAIAVVGMYARTVLRALGIVLVSIGLASAGGVAANGLSQGQYSDGRVLFERETAVQYLTVVERSDGERRLLVNEGLGVQSSYTPGSVYAGNYTDLFPLLPLSRVDRHDASDDPIRVLLIGVAGGSIARVLEGVVHPVHPVYTDGIEFDPAMVDVAEMFFDINTLETLEIHETDGRVFVQRTDTTYDYVFIDAFQNETTIPAHLTTQEFFEEVQHVLAPDGIVAMNVISLQKNSQLSQRIASTLSSVFPSVYVANVPRYSNQFFMATGDASFSPVAIVPVELPSELEWLRTPFASAESIQRMDVPPLTDDRSPVPILTMQMFFALLSNQWTAS